MRNAAEGHPAANLDDLDRSLDEANTHLRALLDLTTHAHLSPLMPPMSSTPPAPPPPPVRSHDFPDDHRRSKRRKLDLDRPGPGLPVFRYGRYGQVEAGQLRMEIVSCDGGIFLNEALYAAENILRNDCSVYCTKGNRCNVVLRHQGGTVFTLQELIIKAPARTSYSHPVREGMVFIAMEQDDMLSRTAQYQIQYGQPSQSRSPSGRGGSGGPGSGDDRSSGRHIISIRHHDDGSTSTTRARRSWINRADEDDENRVPQMPREFAANQPEFRVTTECSDDEEDEAAYAGSRPFRRPPNIGYLPFENQDSDPEDIPDPFSSDDPADDILLHHSRRQALHRARYEQRERDRHRERDAQMSLADAYDAHANATQEAMRAVGGSSLLVPHARFFIEKKKSKCTIRFDPPVSGRFILLKMWSSQHDPGSNIDIQSVIARGFAGPRYFPVVESR
ncbi:hypothetical protein ESCO_001347 [Escovopsis weberi]|uniref:Regulator of chromosome condensation n=1 Tax=Escovopsis weberi TaxID=150374 RepID=A0A0M9VTQ6_ESCWE|nr:hypothetical protein ESCO_001347 [Escovopsis weberi]